MEDSDPSEIMIDCILDPDDLTEAQTRRALIDRSLVDAQWKMGIDCKTEVPLFGLATPSGNGFADYILYVDGKPCAVVEAKKSSIDPNAGWTQAKDYARSIEKETGTYPVIFLTNGVRTLIDDGKYPLRVISGFYSAEDLRKWLYIRKNRDWKFSSSRSLENPDATLSIHPPEFIEQRLYQCMALNKAITSFARGNRRSLLVMATGSGKTRVVNAISKILIEYHWATRILFLVDRKELVNQAGNSFSENLKESVSIIHSDNKDKNFDARILISCYPSMMTAIQNQKVDGHMRFTAGYFDLIVIDEAHRSVYDKYKNIIDHFDALIIGLTATPRDSIDRDTYEFFDIYDKRPTFEYTLEEGVKDGYLCPPKLIRPRTSILTNGAEYKELSEEDRRMYELAFRKEDGRLPPKKAADDFYKKIYNEETMKIVFRQLEENGLTVDNGNTLGKTIIFAPSHKYAELILNTFKKFHKELCLSNPEYIKIIDYETCGHNIGKKRSESKEIETYNKSIDDFKTNEKFRIAISVEMLTTGVDIPSLLNLVFYRYTSSRVLLQQMIGRGTRTCKGLIDGRDKSCFHIFDYCNNDFNNEIEDEPPINKTLSQVIFNIKVEMIIALQSSKFTSPEYVSLRNELVDSVLRDIESIDRDNFIVKDSHLPFVLSYSNRDKFECLNSGDREILSEHIAPIVKIFDKDIQAERFDALMYIIESKTLENKNKTAYLNDLKRKVKRLKKDCMSISEVRAKAQLLDEISNDDCFTWDVFRFESIRKELRSLMQYIPKKSRFYTSRLSDEVIGVDVEEIDLSKFGTEDYRSKVNAIIDKYADCESIQKIHRNEIVTEDDLMELESILTTELGGSIDDFNEIFEGKSLIEVVRRHVGLDSDVVDQAFRDFVTSHDLTDEMYHFVTKITKYLKANGILLKEQLLKQPFSYGINYLQQTFGDNMQNYLSDIGGIIDGFNKNAGLP